MKGSQIMIALPVRKLPRFFTAFLLSILLAFLAGHARAEPDLPKPAGPWMVVKAKDPANVGLIFFFSPDNTFGLVDPKTQLGAAGIYSVGRTGLMINVFGVGKSAEFMGGDLDIAGDTMTIDVKRSGFMEPQRVVLQRVKITQPAAGPVAK
jgi:hypothetical protein